ncbi:MAG: ATP-binding protein [Roseomonas sp.]|nr:ATP-binding protein [Roseomonas sp.]
MIARLNGEYEGRLRLHPIAWEQKTYGAHDDFQAQIEATATCDLVIGILWNRIGSALDAARYARPETGEPYESGTVFEIETALDLRRHAQLPDVALFQKNAPPLTAPSHAEAAELARNLGLMEAIRRRWQFTKTGAFKAAFNSFSDPDEFERLLEQHLRAWLAERGHGADGVVWRIRDPDGRDRTPYPGFEAYGAEYAPVFCGRDQVLELCLQDLRAAAQRGCAFLLLLGASGAGKSSLARAGLLPRLNKAGAAPGVDGWREAIFRPGQDPLAALARALFAALPELAETGTPTPAVWCATVRGHAEAAANSVKAALTNAATKATTPRRLKLLLLADQLEEAFAATPEERAAFAAAVAALARGGDAWVLATLRDDRYAGLLEQPLLLALKRDGATQDLIPPEGAELEAVIREPARRSRLHFERDAEGRDLADELRRAVTSADALPLLQMTLSRLFEERDRDSDTMTFRAYREFGGLGGVVDKQAEEVFARADPAAAAELPALLLGLVGGVTEEGRVLAREAPAAVLADTPAREALLALMVEGRLLLTDGREAPDGTRQIWVRVAHEALLRNWTRAAAILAPEPLRAKPRVEQAQRDWEAGGEREADLLRGGLLEGAQALVTAHGAALPEALRDFVVRSSDSLQQELRKAKRRAMVFALFALVSIGAAGGAGWFWQQARDEQAEAERQRQAVARSLGLSQGMLDSATRVLTLPDYSDIASLEPMQRALLETLLPFYQRLLTEASNDPVATSRYARSLISLARLKSSHDSMATAEREFEAGYNALSSLRRQHGLPPDFTDTLALAAFGYAEQLVERGDRARARSILDQTGALIGNSDTWQLRRACALIGGDPVFEPLPEAKALASQVAARSSVDLGTSGVSVRDHALCAAVAALLLGEKATEKELVADRTRGANQGTQAEAAVETPISAVLFDQATAALDLLIAEKPHGTDLLSRRIRIEIFRARWRFGQALENVDFNESRRLSSAASGHIDAAERIIGELAQLAPESRRRYADRAMLSLLRFEISVHGRDGDLALERLHQWLADSIQLVRLDPDSIAVRGQITQRIRVFASIVGRSNEVAFGLPACRAIFLAIDVLEAVQPEGNQFLEASLHAAQCLVRLRSLIDRSRAAVPPNDPDDTEIFAAARQKWRDYLGSFMPPAQMLEAATWRLRFLWEASSVGRYGVDSFFGADTILNQEFPDAIEPRYLLAMILVTESARLVADGKPDEAMTAVERCLGPTPLSRAICAQIIRENLARFGESLNPFLEKLVSEHPSVLFLRTADLFGNNFSNKERKTSSSSVFGTAFGPEWDEERNYYTAVISSFALNNHIFFTDEGLRSSLGSNVPYFPGHSLGGTEVSPVVRFVLEANQLQLNAISAYKMTQFDFPRTARAFGWAASGNATEAPQARAWLTAPEQREMLHPYLTLYHEIFGAEWVEYMFGGGLERYLSDERGTILLQGKNIAGDTMYTYVHLTLRNLIRLRDTIREKRDFDPRDFGTVIAAGSGDVPMWVRIQLTVRYRMLDVPRPNPVTPR